LERTKAKRVPMIVVDKNGLQGTVAQEEALSSTHESQLLVQFQNGQEVIVPKGMLIRHEDGRYHLPASVEMLLADQEKRSAKNSHRYTVDNVMDGDLVVPVTAETINVQTRSFESGIVEIRKTVHERSETVDQPLQSEEVEIERVAVNRIVNEAVPIRHEGDTMIISLLEEVLVIEKRLVLREELHIKKLHKEVHNPQEVLLREERVEIVRKPSSGQGFRQDETKQ
jgi:uncharacterized protein (TIGR02271 family)